MGALKPEDQMVELVVQKAAKNSPESGAALQLCHHGTCRMHVWRTTVLILDRWAWSDVAVVSSLCYFARRWCRTTVRYITASNRTIDENFLKIRMKHKTTFLNPWRKKTLNKTTSIQMNHKIPISSFTLTLLKSILSNAPLFFLSFFFCLGFRLQLLSGPGPDFIDVGLIRVFAIARTGPDFILVRVRILSYLEHGSGLYGRIIFVEKCLRAPHPGEKQWFWSFVESAAYPKPEDQMLELFLKLGPKYFYIQWIVAKTLPVQMPSKRLKYSSVFWLMRDTINSHVSLSLRRIIKLQTLINSNQRFPKVIMLSFLLIL